MPEEFEMGAVASAAYAGEDGSFPRSLTSDQTYEDESDINMITTAPPGNGFARPFSTPQRAYNKGILKA